MKVVVPEIVDEPEQPVLQEYVVGELVIGVSYELVREPNACTVMLDPVPV